MSTGALVDVFGAWILLHVAILLNLHDHCNIIMPKTY